jgi:hypothetical protein
VPYFRLQIRQIKTNLIVKINVVEREGVGRFTSIPHQPGPGLKTYGMMARLNITIYLR